MGRQVNTY